MRTCLCDAGILNNKEKPFIFMLTIFSLFGAMLPSAEGKKCTLKRKKKKKPLWKTISNWKGWELLFYGTMEKEFAVLQNSSIAQTRPWCC